jgi:DNA segregation ATPase FtsK/SpoIIIE, S-DNA-T family
MPRSSSSSSSFASSGVFGFLPEPVQIFLSNRVREFKAGAIALLGLAVISALLSFHISDPSFNTATSTQDIKNWMGLYGAYGADILLQSFGYAAFILGVTLCVWGYRVLNDDDMSPFSLRLLTLILSIVFCAVGCVVIPGFGWVAQSHGGGMMGVMIYNFISGLLAPHIPSEMAALVTSLIFFAAGLWLWNIALALRADERRVLIESVLTGGSHAAVGASSLWYMLRQRFSKDEERVVTRRARHHDPDDEDEEDEEDEDEDGEEYDDSDMPSFLRTKKPSNIEVVRPKKAAKEKPAKKAPKQEKLNLREPEEWELPPLDLLDEVPESKNDEKVDENSLRRNAGLLQNVLQDYNVKGDISSIHPGPVVTLYELEPAPGTKTSRVIGLSDDIARSMSAVSVRVAVVPGRNVIGIELPNKKRQTVFLRDLLEGRDFDKTAAKLPLVLGKDIGGAPIIADLSRMPHLLVAGTTGSGKSVAVNTMILSLLYRLPPEKCRFIMIDPKMLELSVYDDIPHLLAPVVTEPGRAVVALKWVVQEMENRYRNMSKLGVRNIDGYNQRLKEARRKGEVLMRKVQTGFDPETGKPVYEEQPLDLTELPYIVVIVDEFADLMLVAGKDVESAIQRLAQMARAAGIHLIMATQRPSVDVITGVIKANFPTRISFQVTSKIDSRTILGEGGAETLLGMGDMLYMAAGGRITRVHGPFVSDGEVESVVNFLKAQGEPAYLEDITEGDLFAEGEGEAESSGDELYDQALALIAREGKASTSFIQRHLQIGYNRAARIIEEMEKQGVVGPANHVGKREVLVGNHSRY